MTETPLGKLMVDKQDFDRLENKVDELMNALAKLILIDERQMNQGQRIGTLESYAKAEVESIKTKLGLMDQAFHTKIAAVDKKVDKWINMGLGGWAIASTLLVLWQVFGPHIKG